MKRKIIIAISVLLIIVISSFIYQRLDMHNDYKEKYLKYTFINNDSKFQLIINNVIDKKHGDTILKKITDIKFNTIDYFLINENREIAFKPENIDTLKLKLEKEGGYSYTSSLSLGALDKTFNEQLIKRISKFLLDKKVTYVEIYTLTPEEYGQIPLPPFVLNNKKGEEVFSNIDNFGNESE